MEKTMQGRDAEILEKRLAEIEIKTAFLEKELEEYKEASRNFYRKLSLMEEQLQKLQKEIPEPGLPDPEPSWDSENRDIHP
jgi:uncharacterized coiled-coil protein SlyX